MIEIWITREQTGILQEHHVTPDELEADLRGLEVYGELTPMENIKVELTGRWEDLKQFFVDIQALANFVRGTDYEKDSEQDKLITRLSENKLIKP